MTPISLVTGGAGFIGSHVADQLIKMGHTVIVIDDLSGGYENNLPPQAIFYNGSINDEALLDRIFAEHKVDYMFHLAAYAAEGLSHFIRKFNYENNVIGSINLINRAVKNKIKRFVYTSSIAVYGGQTPPFRENTVPMPEDPYGIAKYTVELDLAAANKLFGLKYTIFRPHNVYGERQNLADPYRNVIGIFMNQCLRSEPLSLYGDGLQTRAFTYIDDVAPFIAGSISIPETKNKTYNIGSDDTTTVLNLAKLISQIMGVKENITFLPARKEVVHAFSDHTKTKETFGIKKTTQLQEGIAKMAHWAKKIGPQQLQRLRKVEIEENLPTNWRKAKA